MKIPFRATQHKQRHIKAPRSQDLLRAMNGSDDDLSRIMLPLARNKLPAYDDLLVQMFVHGWSGPFKCGEVCPPYQGRKTRGTAEQCRTDLL